MNRELLDSFLEKFGYPNNASFFSLNLRFKNLDKRYEEEQFDQKTQEEYFALNSIVEYPEEYGFDKETMIKEQNLEIFLRECDENIKEEEIEEIISNKIEIISEEEIDLFLATEDEFSEYSEEEKDLENNDLELTINSIEDELEDITKKMSVLENGIPEEGINATTYQGRNPPRRRKPKNEHHDDHDFVHNYASEYRQKINRHNAINKKRSMSLGEDLNNRFDWTPGPSAQIRPVNDKGILLFCNNLSTANLEISNWESSMDIALGLHSEWSSESKIAYMENTLHGNAKVTWQAFCETDRYTSWLSKFNESQGKGGYLGQVLRWQICGHLDREADKSKAKDLALTYLNNIKMCSLDYLDLYNETFSRLLWINGNILNTEYLRLYFTKLPQPFGELMRKEYVEDERDSIGCRIKFVKERIEKFCLDNRIRSQTKKSVRNICSQTNPPNLEFGCAKISSSSKRRTKSKRKKFKPKFRKSKRFKKNFKPKWVKKKPRTSKKKEVNKVKCFGCQKIGHYANKCPNKTFAKKVSQIEDLGFLAIDEIDLSENESISCYEYSETDYSSDSTYSSSSGYD